MSDGREQQEQEDMWDTDAENWEPAEATSFDSEMAKRCATVEERLLSATHLEKLAFLADTRAVHEELYEGFTPSGSEVYAGNYRGLVGTPLESYWPAVDVTRGGNSHAVARIAHPSEVSTQMDNLARQIGALNFAGTNPGVVLMEMVNVWTKFLKIHPYANGNGHVSRLMVAVMASMTQFQLRSSWSVHPGAIPDVVKLALLNTQDKENVRAIADFFRTHMRWK